MGYLPTKAKITGFTNLVSPMGNTTIYCQSHTGKRFEAKLKQSIVAPMNIGDELFFIDDRVAYEPEAIKLLCDKYGIR